MSRPDHSLQVVRAARAGRGAARRVVSMGVIWLAALLGCAQVAAAAAPSAQVVAQEAEAALQAETAEVARLWGFSRGKAPLSAAVMGPAPAGLPDALSGAAACEDCHVKEAAEWRTSGHRQSWTRPLFQRAYALEPMAECRNCHQPLTAERPARDRATRALRDEGVTCAVCHVRAGQVLAATRSGRAPHPVREARLLSSAAFCGGCHQFPFPEHRQDGEVVFTNEPMQDTLEEWRRQRDHGAGARTCQDCHMPQVGARRSHAFAGGYDGALLQSAVAVSAALEGEALVLRLRTSASSGHAVPTGDLFRSLVLSAEVLDGRGRVLGAAEPEVLTRRFVDVAEALPDGRVRLVRQQAMDGRLQPGEERVVRLALPVLAAGRGRTAAAVRYRVRLHRLPPGGDVRSSRDAVSLIHEGLVAAAPRPSTSLAGAARGPKGEL